MSAWLNGAAWHGVALIAAVFLFCCGILSGAWWLWLREDEGDDDGTLRSVPADGVPLVADEARVSGVAVGALPLPPLVPAVDPPAVDRGPTDLIAELVAAGQIRRAENVRLMHMEGTPSLYPYGAELRGKARRRAIHKGRIPHPVFPGGTAAPAAGVAKFPGPVSDGPVATRARMSADASTSRVGEPLPPPLTIYDPAAWGGRWMPVFPTLLESIAWEAEYAEWGRWLGAQLLEFRDWYDKPDHWELAA